MVISITVFNEDPLYIHLLKEINKIAIEKDHNELDDTLLFSLAGLCLGLKPSKIAEELGKANSGYVRFVLSTKLYKYIKILTGKEGESTSWKKIKQWLGEWLKQVQREINSSKLTLADISSTPSITAEKFINPAQKVIFEPVKTGFLPSDIVNLNRAIDDADKLYKAKQYNVTIKAYQSIITQVFAHYPSESRFMGVLVKAVSCYNKLEAYADVEELSGFALEYIKDEKGRADLYTYMAEAWHELYLRSNNSQHFRNARNYYGEAKKKAEYDCIILWNIFDLYLEAHNRSNRRVDYSTAMKLAWKAFLQHKQDPKSNFEDHKNKILQDRDRILQENPNNRWLLDNLQRI